MTPHLGFHRRPSPLLALLALLLGMVLAGGRASAQGVVTDCTQAGLQTAMAGGGLVTFACEGTIALTNEIRVLTNTILDATGHSVIISGPTGTNATGLVRLFHINTNVVFSLTNLTLIHGRHTNGGAIYNNRGTLSLRGCVLSNNVAITRDGSAGAKGNDKFARGGNGRDGGSARTAAGGAIYNNYGTTVVAFCSFVTNSVLAGHGGEGGSGGNAESSGGDGGHGGKGAAAVGGAIYNLGTLTVAVTTFQFNLTEGGDGGLGGAGGAGVFPGYAGNGGAGGAASGAAIYNHSKGRADISYSTFTLNTARSGHSAAAGRARIRPPRGAAGPDSRGGALCNYGTSGLFNCTFFANRVTAGDGGTGGTSDFQGGTGGAGGSGRGGGLYNAKKAGVTNCTFYSNGATGGTNGAGGAGIRPGKNGDRGRSRGGNLSSSDTATVLKNTLLAFALPGTNNYGRISDKGYNLSSDRSVALRGTSKMNQDPLLGSFGRNGGATDTVPLLANSPAIDVVPTISSPPLDQRGVSRPLGAGGDIGAYEYGLTLVAPVIITQPQPRIVQVGGNITFSVVAQADPPVTYQWRFAGNNIAGAVGSSHTITNAQRANAGNYDVIVANNAGTVTSTAAALTVMTPATITLQPVAVTVAQGAAVTFRVTAAGDPTLRYQWFHDGTNVLLGATLATLTLPNVLTNDAGSYSVLVVNDFSSVRSAGAVLTVTNVAPAIVTPPQSVFALPGDRVSFTVVVSGSLPLRYHWYFNETNLLGPFLNFSNVSTITSSNVLVTDYGSYFVVVTNIAGSVTSAPVLLVNSAVAPMITVPPTNLTVDAGAIATFSVTATGIPTPTYFWFFNDTNLLASGPSPVLSINNAQSVNEGEISVVVSNAAGTVRSDPVTLTVRLIPPVITQQPTNVIVFESTNVTFTVVATGSEPLSYQWFIDGFELDGATSSVLTLTNVTEEDAGAYHVEVANAAGTDISLEATLTFSDSSPIILTNPASAAVVRGSTATFTVSVLGPPPIAYQWLFDGEAIPGATNVSLSITNVAYTNSGNYSVVVTNEFSTEDTVSEDAVLTVLAPVSSVIADDLQFVVTIVFLSEDGVSYKLESFNDDEDRWDEVGVNAEPEGSGTMKFVEIYDPEAPPRTFRVVGTPAL